MRLTIFILLWVGVAQAGPQERSQKLAVLEPMDHQLSTGRLQVRTERGVTVSIDGVEVGQGPQVHKELPAGPHIIELQSPCHQRLEVSVAIEAGALATVTLTPEPLLATLTVKTVNAADVPLKAQIEVDGAALGHSPGSFQVPVCAKRLKLTASGLLITETLSLNKERPTRLTVVLKTPGSARAGEARQKKGRITRVSWPRCLMASGLVAFGMGYMAEDLEQRGYKASAAPYLVGATLVTVGIVLFAISGGDDDEAAAQLGVTVGPGSVNLGGRW